MIIVSIFDYLNKLYLLLLISINSESPENKGFLIIIDAAYILYLAKQEIL